MIEAMFEKQPFSASPFGNHMSWRTFFTGRNSTSVSLQNNVANDEDKFYSYPSEAICFVHTCNNLSTVFKPRQF